MRFLSAVAAGASVVFAVPALAATSPPVLRLDGIGPLKLGMTRAAALSTGWLAHRGTGCQLGGAPFPVTYRLDGVKAPAGVRGVAEFVSGKLTDVSVIHGVRTATGVVVGRSTVAQMVSRYRAAGFSTSSRYDSTFAGTFVTVKRRGAVVLNGFAMHGIVDTLAIPMVQVCE